MKRKRIALVVDMENWAFDIEAKILRQSLEKYYKIDIFVSHNYEDNLFRILEDVKDYDMIHFFWRKLLLQLDSDEFQKELEKNHYDYEEYIDSIKGKISTGIYDHLFTDDENRKVFQNIFTKYCKRYYTCSKKIEEIYKKIEEYPAPWGTIHDTYDNVLYDGGDRTRFDKKDEEALTIGWVGNSNWNLKYKDFKGFHTILNPVIDSLVEEGYKIKKHYADRIIKFRTNEEMPSYYQEIDLCIITSTEEGTPRPVIEAMASGVPILSTDVGIVSEVFGPKQKKYILGERTIENDDTIKENLKNKIIEIYNNREILKELSKENYEYSASNGIDALKETYKKYFDEFLSE